MLFIWWTLQEISKITTTCNALDDGITIADEATFLESWMCIYSLLYCPFNFLLTTSSFLFSFLITINTLHFLHLIAVLMWLVNFIMMFPIKTKYRACITLSIIFVGEPWVCTPERGISAWLLWRSPVSWYAYQYASKPDMRTSMHPSLICVPVRILSLMAARLA